MAGPASFPPIAPDFQVDGAQGELIEALGFGLPLDRRQSAGTLYEVSEVILDAHNDRLRRAALIDHEPLLIVLDPLEDLSELGAGGESWYDSCHCLFGAQGAFLPPRLL
jgi:hypothetical protein